MPTTVYVNESDLEGIQGRLDALRERLLIAAQLLEDTDRAVRKMVSDEMQVLLRRHDSVFNNLAARAAEGIETQNKRLALLYLDPTEDVAVLATLVDGFNRPYCCPSNQAQSFRVHIAQLYQFGHRGIIAKNAAYYRPSSGASKPRPSFARGWPRPSTSS